MDRVLFYKGQFLEDTDLDLAFDKAEAAVHKFAIDSGNTGIVFLSSDLDDIVAETDTPSTSVVVASVVAYTSEGKRVAGPTEDPDNTVDVFTETATELPIAVSEGKARVASLFLVPDVSETDEVIDEDLDEVPTRRTETYTFEVVPASSEYEPGVEEPVLPDLREDAVLIADITIPYGATVVRKPTVPGEASVSTARTQYLFSSPAGEAVVVRATSLRQALLDVVALIAGIVTADLPASAIPFGEPALAEWRDSTATMPADATVKQAVDSLFLALDDEGAAARIGATPHGVLVGTTVAEQIDELLPRGGGVIEGPLIFEGDGRIIADVGSVSNGNVEISLTKTRWRCDEITDDRVITVSATLVVPEEGDVLYVTRVADGAYAWTLKREDATVICVLAPLTHATAELVFRGGVWTLGAASPGVIPGPGA